MFDRISDKGLPITNQLTMYPSREIPSIHRVELFRGTPYKTKDIVFSEACVQAVVVRGGKHMLDSRQIRDTGPTRK